MLCDFKLICLLLCVRNSLRERAYAIRCFRLFVCVSRLAHKVLDRFLTKFYGRVAFNWDTEQVANS